MALYKLLNDQTGNPRTEILRTNDNAIIPEDVANRDWRAYKTWVDAGNEPDPAD